MGDGLGVSDAVRAAETGMAGVVVVWVFVWDDGTEETVDCAELSGVDGEETAGITPLGTSCAGQEERRGGQDDVLTGFAEGPWPISGRSVISVVAYCGVVRLGVGRCVSSGRTVGKMS